MAFSTRELAHIDAELRALIVIFLKRVETDGYRFTEGDFQVFSDSLGPEYHYALPVGISADVVPVIMTALRAFILAAPEIQAWRQARRENAKRVRPGAGAKVGPHRPSPDAARQARGS